MSTTVVVIQEPLIAFTAKSQSFELADEAAAGLAEDFSEQFHLNLRMVEAKRNDDAAGDILVQHYYRIGMDDVSFSVEPA